MKKLLLVLLCAFSIHAFSQATANDAPNLSQCGNEVFNLTVQTPIILGNQSAGQFTVTYFLSQADADSNVGAIANPAIFISPEFVVVYARVDNTSDATFATTSFQVSWEVPFQVADIPNVAACGSYTLLPTLGVTYSADEAGTIAVPSTITATMTIYRHLDDFPCSIPSSFDVTINQVPVAMQMPDFQVCDSFVLPALPMGQTYHSAPGGSAGTIIPAGVVISVTSVIYIFAQSGTTPNCTDESSFVVTVNQIPIVDQLPDVFTCESFTLPTLNGLSMYYTGPNGTGTTLTPGTVITTSMTVYIVAQTGGAPNCISESSFTVTITNSSVITDLPDVSACDAYTLPVLPSGNYYTGPGGTGDLLPAGTEVTISTDVYVYVQSGDCWFDSVFHVNIGNPIILPQEPLVACDSNQDGFATFNLSPAAMAINTGVTNVGVSFFETMADAIAGANPVSFEYHNIVANTQTLYYRRTVVNDNDCFSVGELELQTVPCPSISGVVRFDADNNGCTDTDDTVANAQVALVVGNYLIYAYTDANGEYSFDNLAFGNYYISMASTLGNPVGATNVAISANENYTADFCIVPVVATNDVITYMWPTTNARPGFSASYQVQIFNNGSTVQSGTVALDYDDVKLNFSGATPPPASQSSGQLLFNFANLQPGNIQTYYVFFMVEVPPTANVGEVITFTAAADSALVDATPDNNTATVSQVLVNSYDPNDKTVLQEAFLNDDTQNYLRYVVRFQNTGTAEAVNVAITDQLDQNVDWSTFRPVSASHNYSAQLNEVGLVTFNFDNINLPDSTTDEPASHGFVTYEVKLKSGLTVNDNVFNTANIYFDFNSPIVTNTVMTDLVDLLGVGNHTLSTFTLYPNPASGAVAIQMASEEDFTMELFDIRGKKIIEKNGQGSLLVDVSTLQQGIYLVKVVSGNAVETKKLIIK
jgi:uncharacterized repeat protein (TIGR01451 family)